MIRLPDTTLTRTESTALVLQGVFGNTICKNIDYCGVSTPGRNTIVSHGVLSNTRYLPTGMLPVLCLLKLTPQAAFPHIRMLYFTFSSF